MRRKVVAQVLEAHYTVVVRMSRGLCGREDSARTVLRFIMSRSVHAIPKWQANEDADRWFSHHTVLAARRNSEKLPKPEKDLLVTASRLIDSPYVAFVRAVRNLPFQQREAVILHHGEKLTPRQLGIAMDCSVEASERHLKAASSTLQAAAGPQWTELVDRMSAAYVNLSPQGQTVRPLVRRYLDRFLWPRRIIRWTLTLLVLGALAWLVWTWRQRILDVMPYGK